MNKMVDIMEDGRRNELWGVDNRPSDVVGDTLMQRFNTVTDMKDSAGELLDIEADKLRGQEIDVSPAFNSLFNRLDRMDIGRGDEGLDFAGSAIQDLPGPEDLINNVMKRLNSINPKSVDANDVHKLKQFLDEQISYGKTQTGARGKTERVVSEFRRELDSILDSNFESYNEVNTRYSETKTALDNFENAAGTIDLQDLNADKAVGTRMRALMSNQQSRIALSNSMQALEDVGKRHGAEFDGNVKLQALFANELDRVFKPVADTSLAGELSAQGDRTVQQLNKWQNMSVPGAVYEGGKAVGAGIGRLTDRDFSRVTDENKYKTIRKILE